MRRRSCHRPLQVLLAVSLLLMGAVAPAAGQVGRPEVVRLNGHVQSIGGDTIILMTYCMLLERDCRPFSITIDLKHVPLDQYRGIRAGDWVVVEGVVSHRDGRHRVTATSVMLVEELEAP